MPIVVRDLGVGNRCEISDAMMKAQTWAITFRGNGNLVRIADGTVLSGSGASFGHDCTFVAERSRLASLQVFTHNGATISIGEACTFTWATSLFAHEPSRITIGSDCLIASGTRIITSDMHGIYDMRSGGRINPAGDVVLEDRVWLGVDAHVLKGAHIGHDSVIGAGAVVTSDIPPHCVASGSPARVVRLGVVWRRTMADSIPPAGEAAAPG